MCYHKHYDRKDKRNRCQLDPLFLYDQIDTISRKANRYKQTEIMYSYYHIILLNTKTYSEGILQKLRFTVDQNRNPDEAPFVIDSKES